MKFDLSLKIGSRVLGVTQGYTLRQSLRPCQALSNDMLKSKIGHVSEKLLKYSILLGLPLMGPLRGNDGNWYSISKQTKYH